MGYLKSPCPASASFEHGTTIRNMELCMQGYEEEAGRLRRGLLKATYVYSGIRQRNVNDYSRFDAEKKVQEPDKDV